MAGRGPAPKANRVRRSAPTRGEWVDLPPLAEPVLAPLPERYRMDHRGGEPLEVPWPDASLMLWESWRMDPVTAQWGPADFGLAFDTIRLHAASPTDKASEIRLRMDNLGLTPKGKRDNRWRLVHDAPALEGDAPTPATRTRLRAV